MAGKWTVMLAHTMHAFTESIHYVDPTLVNPTSLIGELSQATNLSFTHDLAEGATFSWSMPGNTREAAQVIPLERDVIVIRDNVVMQRFRVWGRQLTESGGVWTGNYTAISYKQLLKKRIFREADTRSFGADVQTCFNTIMSEAQAHDHGSLGIGSAYTIDGADTIFIVPADLPATGGVPYFPVGKPLFEAMNEICEATAVPPFDLGYNTGAEWDIEPLDQFDPDGALNLDPWDPNYGLNHLKLKVWYPVRNNHRAHPANLQLDYGGNFTDITHAYTGDAYANEMHFNGGEGVTGSYWEGIDGSSTFPPEIHEAAEIGLIEAEVTNVEVKAGEAGQRVLGATLWAAESRTPQIQGRIPRGKWRDKTQVYLGDFVSVLLYVPMVDIVNGSPVQIPGEYALQEDVIMRIVQFTATVDSNGVEDISFQLGVLSPTTRNDFYLLDTRVTKLERLQ